MSLIDGDQYDRAIATTARHLARTALILLADVASAYEPVTIRTALSMISQAVIGDLSIIRAG
jgi:hypothetical protein